MGAAAQPVPEPAPTHCLTYAFVDRSFATPFTKFLTENIHLTEPMTPELRKDLEHKARGKYKNMELCLISWSPYG